MTASRIWHLMGLRLLLALPLLPWLILLMAWADRIWERQLARDGEIGPNITTMVTIPLLALGLLVIDALVAATLLHPYLIRRLQLTPRPALLFWRWLAASAIGGLVVAISMEVVPVRIPTFLAALALGCLTFSALLIMRATAAPADDDEPVDDPPASAAAPRAPLPPPLPDRAPITDVLAPLPPATWSQSARDFGWRLYPLLHADDVVGLAAARSDADVLLARRPPFPPDALAVALDAYRASYDAHQVRIAAADLLDLLRTGA